MTPLPTMASGSRGSGGGLRSGSGSRRSGRSGGLSRTGVVVVAAVTLFFVSLAFPSIWIGWGGVTSQRETFLSTSAASRGASRLQIVCSHKFLARAAHPAAPLTLPRIAQAWGEVVLGHEGSSSEGGVRCLDLDISPIELPTESSISAKHGGAISGTTMVKLDVIGHPVDVLRGKETGVITSLDAAEIFATLRLLEEGARGLSPVSDPPVRDGPRGKLYSPTKLFLTLEAKGVLGKDAVFLKRLAEAIGLMSVSAGVEIAVLGVEEGVAPPGMPLALAMRAKEAFDPTRQSQQQQNTEAEEDEDNAEEEAETKLARACGMLDGESPSAFAKRIASYAVVLPATQCMRVPRVRAGLAKWRAYQGIGGGEGEGGGDRWGRRHVRVWTADDCNTAREMMELGATHVISNIPLDLMDECAGLTDGGIVERGTE
jgi:hypothetical protein